MFPDSEIDKEQQRAEERLDRFESLERRVSELEARMSKIDQLQGRGADGGDSASGSGVDTGK